MKTPTLEEILKVVERSIMDEKYIKMLPIYLQDDIRNFSKYYPGSIAEAIFKVVAVSVHRHLVEITLNTEKEYEA